MSTGHVEHGTSGDLVVPLHSRRRRRGVLANADAVRAALTEGQRRLAAATHEGLAP
jgi:hypothetical protein